jgi:transmembrane sensor
MTENRLVALLCEIASEEEPGELPAEVQRWAALSPENEAVVRVAVDAKVRGEELRLYEKPDPDEAYARWQASLGIGDTPEALPIPRPTRSRLATAAIIIAAMIGVGLLVVKVVRQPDTGIAETSLPSGRNKAKLTLADGKVILLDTAKPGEELAFEKNTVVTKADTAVVVYSHSARGLEAVIGFDELATPRSGQYRLILPDGSHVWLNSESRLRFPSNFMGNARTVELSGEAYFEIAPDAAKPFYVVVNGRQKIQVLGTAFNVMAYPNEDTLRTTLLSGDVLVSTSKQTMQLKPGEQAKVDAHGGISRVQEESAESIASWKNGLFYFDETPFKEVMRQLARWYDLDVVYKVDPGESPFTGDFRRNTPIKDIVKYFKTERVQCRLDGRQLIVEAQ